MLIQPFNLQTPFNLFFPNNILHRKASGTESHDWIKLSPLFSFPQFEISLSLTLMTLILLKILGQLLCTNVLSLGLSDVSLWLESGSAAWARSAREGCCILNVSSHNRHKLQSILWLMMFTVIAWLREGICQASPLFSFQVLCREALWNLIMPHSS